MKKILLFYQKFISPLKPKCCRFYPTCSDYALWQVGYNSFFVVILTTLWRICRCHPLSKGGFDYPKTKLNLSKFTFFGFGKNFGKFLAKNLTSQISKNKQHIKIKFWFVLSKKNKCFLIKGFIDG